VEYLVDVRDKLKDECDFQRKKEIDESLKDLNVKLVRLFE
jgi:hypothetical protein